MNNYVQEEVSRILSMAPTIRGRWDYRLVRGLARYVRRDRTGQIKAVRYTAKSRGRTGAAVRFHLIQAARARGQA
jgi:hypothetical protein